MPRGGRNKRAIREERCSVVIYQCCMASPAITASNSSAGTVLVNLASSDTGLASMNGKGEAYVSKVVLLGRLHQHAEIKNICELRARRVSALEEHDRPRTNCHGGLGPGTHILN